LLSPSPARQAADEWLSRQREPTIRNGKQLSGLIQAPVIVAPLTRRIGMAAPVFERGLGPFLIQKPGSE